MRSVTDPQLAMVIERLEHVARGVDELKPLASLIVTLQRDQEYTADTLKQLNEIARMRGEAVIKLDRRVLVLERWRNLMVALPATGVAVVLWAAGYIFSYVGTLEGFRRDTHHRISTLEFIINAPNFERALQTDPERPVATGPK